MVSRVLRTAIFTALEGLVTLNSKVVPVYHRVPDGASKPFIEIIGQSENSEDGNKDKRKYDTIVPVAVRTSAIGGDGGDLNADLIAEQIETLLIDNLTLEGYTIVNNTIAGSLSDNREFGNEYQSNKFINFQFNIIKN